MCFLQKVVRWQKFARDQNLLQSVTFHDSLIFPLSSSTLTCSCFDPDLQSEETEEAPWALESNISVVYKGLRWFLSTKQIGKNRIPESFWHKVLMSQWVIVTVEENYQNKIVLMLCQQFLKQDPRVEYFTF